MPSGRRPTRCHPSPKARSSPATLGRVGVSHSLRKSSFLIDQLPFKEQPLNSPKNPLGESDFQARRGSFSHEATHPRKACIDALGCSGYSVTTLPTESRGQTGIPPVFALVTTLNARILMKRWNATLFVLGVLLGLSDVANGQSQVTRPQAAQPQVTQPQAAQPQVTQAAQSAGRGPHRGRMLVSDGFQFELVFSHRSVEIFVFDQDGQPVRLNDVRGRVAFVFGGDRRTFRYDLYPPPRGAPAQNRLYLAVDLSRVPDRGVSVNVALQGLGQRPIKFTIPFQRTRTVEQIAIERQRICPVSGKLLGSMGQPVKVTIDKRDVFVCCAGCESPLRKNPLVHLAKLAPTAPAKATKADRKSTRLNSSHVVISYAVFCLKKKKKKKQKKLMQLKNQVEKHK